MSEAQSGAAGEAPRAAGGTHTEGRGATRAETPYESFRVPVEGGELAGGVWGATDAPAAVLAIHGITASHLSWPLVAERLPGVRLIAPDLRGRGRSNELPPPWGLADHAEDALRLLDRFGVERAVVVGHSMGGFVAGWFAAHHPDRTAALVLVDGGLPMPRRAPADLPPEQLPVFLLGPAGERLTRIYASRDEYLAFWHAHPAFGEDWNDAIEAYVDYDLEAAEGGFRSAARFDPVAANIVQMDGSDGYREALAGVAGPIDFLRAPRGLLNEVPPLYPDELLEASVAAFPALVVHEVPDVNHYGVLMTPGGADSTARVVAAAIARA